MKYMSKVLIGAVVASILIVVALAVPILSNIRDVTVHPTATVALVTDKAEAWNGDNVRLTATLAVGMPDQLVTFRANGTAIGQTFSISRVATMDYIVQNLGTTDIVFRFSAETV